jgi:hypothetical protein
MTLLGTAMEHPAGRLIIVVYHAFWLLVMSRRCEMMVVSANHWRQRLLVCLG